MSEKPLFQNADEAERIFAPQERPAGSPEAQAAHVDEHGSDDMAPTDGTVPAVTLAGGANVGGYGPSVGTTGTASGVAPAAGLAGLNAASDDEDTEGDHDKAAQ